MSDIPLPMPGREGLAARPLHFFFLADCSGSMETDGKIQALNQAIKEALPHMKKAAEDNPQAKIMVRAIKFSSGAQWHVPTPTPVSDFNWTDLIAGGTTDLGKALKMLAEELRTDRMPERGLPPVVVLVTDGEPTDDWGTGLKALMDQPWGKKAVRIAIAIGRDANPDVLQKFIGHASNELKPLQANNPEALIQFIKWASTQVVNQVASPASRPETVVEAGGVSPVTPGVNVTIVPPPAAPTVLNPSPGAGDVW